MVRGVLILTSELAWNVSARESGSWRAPLSGRRSTSWTVVATEAHRQHILTMVPDWHNRLVITQLALGALAVYNLRPSDYTPVEEVNILRALEEHTGPQWCALHQPRVLLADLRRGFLVVRSTACQGEMVALKGLFRKTGSRHGPRPSLDPASYGGS